MFFASPHRSVRRFFPLITLSAALLAPAAWSAPAEDAAVPSRLDAVVAGVGEKVSGVVDGVVKSAAGVVGTALDGTMGVVGGAVDVVQEGQALDLLGVRYRRGGWAFTSATASLSTLHARVPACALNGWIWPTGNGASTAPAA